MNDFMLLWKLNLIYLQILQLSGNNGGEKGPDAQAEAFRQMLSQHMVFIRDVC